MSREKNYYVVEGRFHYDYGVYFNNQFVINGRADWYFEEDKDYYCCLCEVGEDCEVLSYVIKE